MMNCLIYYNKEIYARGQVEAIRLPIGVEIFLKGFPLEAW